MRVGVEVGGTFTDLVAIDGGRVRIAKVPSTPARPDDGALAAIEAAELPLHIVTDLVHGSTVATNAILERKGASIALVVTRGFRDILLLQRHNRKRIYDLFYQKPVPVVARADTFEVAERTGPDGTAVEPLDERAAAAALDRICRGKRYEAVCLLNAYANPAHERRVAEMIRTRRPDLPVTCSSDVTREFREYEPASTVRLADLRATGDRRLQTQTNINCPFASTIAAALSRVKSVLTSPDIPFNDGSKRPITVTAPYGSLVNPRPPAPVRARMLSGYRVFNAVMSALAKVVPDRVIAEGFDTTEVVCLSHLGDDGYRIYLEIFGGGYGASAHGDGCDAVDSPPVESMDLDYDFFRVLEYSVRAESGGAGRHRGGMGFCRRYLITRDNVTLATYGDRFVFAPPGIFGGQPGDRAASHVVRKGRRITIGSKQSFALENDDVLVNAHRRRSRLW